LSASRIASATLSTRPTVLLMTPAMKNVLPPWAVDQLLRNVPSLTLLHCTSEGSYCKENCKPRISTLVSTVIGTSNPDPGATGPAGDRTAMFVLGGTGSGVGPGPAVDVGGGGKGVGHGVDVSVAAGLGDGVE
jgi:hypothetical protein